MLLTAIFLTVAAFCDVSTRPLLAEDLSSLASLSTIALGTVGKDAITPRGKLPEVDGVYLYGQSPEPEQLGHEYMVFEIKQGRVVGALYLPSSEFSCFAGTMQSGKLALMVATGPDSEPYPDSVAAENEERVAAASGGGSGNRYNQAAHPYSVSLQNYYQLPNVSANDKQLLRNCRNSR